MKAQRAVTFSFTLALMASFLCLGAFAQALPVSPPADTGATTTAAEPSSFLSEWASPGTLTKAAFIGSQLADAKTDWKFSLGGKSYTLTPAQRLSMAGGMLGVSIALQHYFPKTKKPVDIAMAIATAYFAGRALANTYSHTAAGSPPGLQALRGGNPVAFAVRLH